MDKKQTYDYVMARQDAGESSDETYDRIADEFFRGAAWELKPPKDMRSSPYNEWKTRKHASHYGREKLEWWKIIHILMSTLIGTVVGMMAWQ